MSNPSCSIVALHCLRVASDTTQKFVKALCLPSSYCRHVRQEIHVFTFRSCFRKQRPAKYGREVTLRRIHGETPETDYRISCTSLGQYEVLMSTTGTVEQRKDVPGALLEFLHTDLNHICDLLLHWYIFAQSSKSLTFQGPKCSWFSRIWRDRHTRRVHS